MIIKQIEIGSMDNFSYIVGCEATRKALVIDPGPDVDRIAAEAEAEGLVIAMIVNTHTHGDRDAVVVQGRLRSAGDAWRAGLDDRS